MATTVEETAGDERLSVFQSSLPIGEKLDRARTELLDLSARNRLLNMPRSAKGARSLAVADEKSAEIFRLLVRDARPFTFLAGKAAAGGQEVDDEAEEIGDLAQPEDDGVDERGISLRHADTRLQTRLTPKGLQKRLLELYFDARALEEEQGVNILYLTLGALKWIDPQNAANVRYAPLILVPVALERGSAGEKFKLRVRQEDYASNLCLEVFLDRTQGIRLPAFEAGEAFDATGYFRAMAEAVSSREGWEVVDDEIVLGFFSFAKFLMYRDLDPTNWPTGARITDRDLVKGLLAEGFGGGGDMIPEEANIDPYIPPAEMLHILDSDSSQALAVHEVRRGRDMVIQGPPGTGKSQTIANIIASAVADGKTVLFVAEKMAALEVVKRRLDATGVGDACLELHSSKANKRALLEELRRTWELGAPRGSGFGTLNARLLAARDRLNAHAARMHDVQGASDLTPYEVVGQLARLRLDGEKPNEVALAEPGNWSPDDYAERHDVVGELVERIGVVGRPDDHAWRGVGLASILPSDVERLTAGLVALAADIDAYETEVDALSCTVEIPRPADLAGLDAASAMARRIASAPDLDAAAVTAEAWSDRPEEIRSLIETGFRHAALHEELAPEVTDLAWTADIGEARAALDQLPGRLPVAAFERLGALARALPRLEGEAGGLARALGRDAPASLADAETLSAVGGRVAAAPDADPAAFASDLWNDGVERAGEVADAVASLEEARSTIDGRLVDAAWDQDLSQARGVLASHGTGFLRLLSGEWRRANRSVRSVLTRPDQPLEETLTVLDALARGRSARRMIDAEGAFAAGAFGTSWRGDRSASAPLRSLVQWMRSLGDLGAEPRMVASRRPDRADVGARTDRLRDLMAEVRPALAGVWDDLEDRRQIAFGSAPDGERADLASLATIATRMHGADEATRAILTDVPPSLEERRRILARLAALQVDATRLKEDAPLGRESFGAAWQDESSHWSALEAAARWMVDNDDIRVMTGRIPDRKEPERRAEALARSRSQIIERLEALFARLVLDVGLAFGHDAADAIPVARLHQRLGEWSGAGERLFQWVAYRDRAERARRLGCADLVARLADGRLEPETAVAAFEMAYFEAVYADQVANVPELGTFDGTLHGRLAREFAEMDRQRISAASFEVVSAHHGRVPARDGGAVGPLGVLRAEMARRRGHMPIRRLMESAGPAVQALKPVLMMSPLSVAQFLAPGVFEFDLLVVDEASQIQPVDALGAVARAKQVVVVGDPKQLPPTAFFSKMTSGGDEDEDATGRVADIESILGLFTARGLPMRMLRWHYRSRHQSLIAVSNRQFYENKLFIVPSPYTAEAGMGLRFHHIPQGIFDSGATRINVVEARIVAQAIVAHAREHPNLSLGVATFSAGQRRAILDQLETLRRTLPPEVEAFFQAHHSEPFFVKNLENVQGDERDVIFVSVGYGPTVPGGRVPMRFGPLGTEGGERRLNVLISRAKQRCEVFASMTDEDIDPDFAMTRKGVQAFRIFMHFARTGRMTLAESTGRDHDSVFEEQVARALQDRGYQVHRQVGLAGFFIDLAVADADRPGRYLLGIECDGASYHDARSARDRDRLRQSVLESHGWAIHRIWSIDWFQRPSEQLELVVARIEAAKAEHDAEAAGRKPSRAVPYDIVTVEREDVTEIGLADAAEPVAASRLYEEAVVERPAHLTCELHEAPRGALSVLAERVVQVEGPVHLDEIVNRIRAAWGLKRAGGRIQDAVDAAVQVSVATGRLEREGDFLTVPGRKPKVRDRGAVASATLRRCEALPPAELEAAALKTVRANYGATDEQVCHSVSRALGFKSTSSQLRDLVAAAVGNGVGRGWLERRNGMLVVGTEAPADAAPPPVPSPLESLIAEGEHERLEFKETLRWDVAQAQPNKKLEDVVVKTLAGLANRVGGTLLIGVADDGSVPGLKRDFACIGGAEDKMQLHLTNLLNNQFGQATRAARIRVSFPELDGRKVCRIDVDRSPSPVFVTTVDARGISAERFFVRSGNSTQELTPSQTATYIRERG